MEIRSLADRDLDGDYFRCDVIPNVLEDLLEIGMFLVHQ